MEQWHKDLNSILESRVSPKYIDENHCSKRFKKKQVIDNDACYHDANINFMVHRYKAGQRTCICGQIAIMPAVMKSKALTGFRHAASTVMVNYRDEWKKFDSSGE